MASRIIPAPKIGRSCQFTRQGSAWCQPGFLPATPCSIASSFLRSGASARISAQAAGEYEHVRHPACVIPATRATALTMQPCNLRGFHETPGLCARAVDDRFNARVCGRPNCHSRASDNWHDGGWSRHRRRRCMVALAQTSLICISPTIDASPALRRGACCFRKNRGTTQPTRALLRRCHLQEVSDEAVLVRPVVPANALADGRLRVVRMSMRDTGPSA